MDETNDYYRQYLLDRYKNLQHKHTLLASPHTFSIETYNASCGDKINLHIRLNESNEIIEQMSFTGEGCLLSTVSAEMLIDEYIGKTIDELQEVSLEKHLLTIGIRPTPTRMKCIELPLLSACQITKLINAPRK